MAASAEDRHVIRFRSAAGKYNFLGLGAQDGRNRTPRAVQFAAGLLSKLMNARCIAEYLGHQRSHRQKHFGRYRRGGVVVEVKSGHGFHYNLISTWRIG